MQNLSTLNINYKKIDNFNSNPPFAKNVISVMLIINPNKYKLLRKLGKNENKVISCIKFNVAPYSTQYKFNT
jgi:hypothetical protein